VSAQPATIHQSAGGSPTSATRISRRLVLLLAASAGLTVANLYYAQPLLQTIAHQFHTSSATAGLIVTFTQVGYAIAQLFLVPVGDIIPRRLLVPAILALAVVPLVLAGLAPNMAVLISVAGLIGLTSAAAQILVPYAAQLAGPDEQGRVVGTVVSGLLLGILLARTVAGIVADLTSWRVVYLGAAGIALLLALVLNRELPSEQRRQGLRYHDLLVSMVHLVRTEPVLRRRAAYGALGFAAFSVFWTTSAFMLSRSPYHYSQSVIGLFGLVGAAGALCATWAGRLHDAGLTTPGTGGFAAAILASFGLLEVGGHSLAALIAGIVVLDIGVQGLHVLNQTTIFSLGEETRSRINGLYLTVYFLGGAVGSTASAWLYDSAGWSAVCTLGAAIGLAALLLWLGETLGEKRGQPAAPAADEGSRHRGSIVGR
jgi:predicted MFS family arabinose efflux permease